MSFEKDITSIMKLTEDNQLFKPASEDDKVARQGNELAILQAKFPVGCKVRTVGLLNTLVYGSNKGYTGTVDSYEKHGGNFKVNVKVSNDHPHSPHIFMEDPEDLEIVNESVKKVNEDNQLFKPASEEDLESRPVYPNILEGQDLDDTLRDVLCSVITSKIDSYDISNHLMNGTKLIDEPISGMDIDEVVRLLMPIYKHSSTQIEKDKILLDVVNKWSGRGKFTEINWE